MITIAAPHRVSLFGGGSDYSDFIAEKGVSNVLGFSIKLYCYVSIIPQSVITEYKYRISYNKVENVSDISEIEHPIVRETLKYKPLKQGFHLVSMADFPAGTGMGTSSTFTVCLLKAIDELNGIQRAQSSLARDAIHIERNVLNETGGLQDQYWAAFGGAGLLKMRPGCVERHSISEQFCEIVESCGILISLGGRRSSSAVAKTTLSIGKKELFAKREYLSNQAHRVFERFNSHVDFNENLEYLIDEMRSAWEVKSAIIEISDHCKNILEIVCKYTPAVKLLGAGQSGFLFAVVNKKNDLKSLEAELLSHGCKFITPSVDHHGVRRVL